MNSDEPIDAAAALSLHLNGIRRLPQPELLEAIIAVSRRIEHLKTLRTALFTEIDKRGISL